MVGLLLGCEGEPPREHLGAYRFPGGEIVSVRRSDDGTLRYRVFSSGESGRLKHLGGARYASGPGFYDTEPAVVEVEFLAEPGAPTRHMVWYARNQPPDTATTVGAEEWVRFTSGDVELAGRLHLPEGAGPYPAVVLVHGSGDEPATEWYPAGDFFVPHGIATLVFDKRGTGNSGGQFTADFRVLAADVAAAVRYLRTRPEIRPDGIGLSGYSQGGWVAPLAASLVPVRFALVNYGMIESPAVEARLEMYQTLEERGVNGQALRTAQELVDAAVEVVASEFRGGWDRFLELRARHRDAPWRHALEGTPVDDLMTYPAWLVKLVGPRFLPPGLDWRYDSTALLGELDTPMTWLLAEEDRSAPNRFTIPKLRRWIEEGRALRLKVYPDTDHGIVRFRQERGERVVTGYHPEYFRDQVAEARYWLTWGDQLPPANGTGGSGNR